MSIFIGLPNLNLTSAHIQVYPDHIEFGASEGNTGGVSVYLSTHDMKSLGEALMETAANPTGITTATSSSRDATTDEISNMLTQWVGQRMSDIGEDETAYKAIDIMDLVVERLGTSMPGAVNESQLS